MTCEQAEILIDILRQHREAIQTRWSLGMWEGLGVALEDIKDAGGVLRRSVDPARPT